MRRGLTLVEMMIGLAIVGLLLTLAAPSFYNYILMQRLKGVSQQLVTDLQFARSEAASRNEFVRVRFSENASMTCYVIFTGAADNSCSCLNANPCPATASEIRTVRFPAGERILVSAVSVPRMMRFEPSNGVMATPAVDLTGNPAQQFIVDVSIDTSRKIRTEIQRSGRPSICIPTGSSVRGEPCL